MTLQQAYDKLAAIGGGTLPLTAKKYILSTPLNIHSSKVQIIGAGKNKTIIEAQGCNAIEVSSNASSVMLHRLTVQTIKPRPLKGIGIFVKPGITANLEIHHCKFSTALNSIHYRNHPRKVPLGNIVIRNCNFPRASIKTDRSFYHQSLPHKVMLWGAQPMTKVLDVSYNRFNKHKFTRGGAIELCIWGDPTNGIGKGPLTLNGGTVIGNTFNGATRECLAISDHHQFVVAFNHLKNSKRVGLYVIRGFRSQILNNKVEGSSYRGHRLANLRECVWARNEVYDSGAEDNTKVGVGGMHISYSHKNLITENVIKATKGWAVAINNGSANNFISNNKIMGRQNKIFVDAGTKNNSHDFDQSKLA